MYINIQILCKSVDGQKPTIMSLRETTERLATSGAGDTITSDFTDILYQFENVTSNVQVTKIYL